MKKTILTLAIAFITLSIIPGKASADTAGSSAVLISINDVKPRDNRAEILRRFLDSRNSPLAPFAKTFVDEADKNRLDWKLVASIAGNESQFGQMIPPNSYNGWGFGVFGPNVRAFSSWNEGITVVSKALRTDYMDSWGAKNVYEIGSFYAEDPTWANKVTNYENQIQVFEDQELNKSLAISL
jgi:hypothetical protein